MNDVDIRESIKPKSDQLNADDLLNRTITIKILAVTSGTRDQPVNISFEGDEGKPWKPCKSMRRVMVMAWGDNGKDWVGRFVTLYNDPDVTWGGVAIGGIRISHLSHIKNALSLSLTANRTQRKPYHVEPLAIQEFWSDEKLNDLIPVITEGITCGKMTNQSAIKKLQLTAQLNAQQLEKIMAIEAPSQQKTA